MRGTEPPPSETPNVFWTVNPDTPLPFAMFTPVIVPAAPDFEIVVPDVSERDNATLAIGAQRIVNAFAPLYNTRLIDTKEFIRLVYRFIAETPSENVPTKFTPINLRGTSRASNQPTPDETTPPENSATPPNQ